MKKDNLNIKLICGEILKINKKILICDMKIISYDKKRNDEKN